MNRFQTVVSNLTCAATQWQRRFLSRGKPTPKAMPSFISEVRPGPARNCAAHHTDIKGLHLTQERGFTSTRYDPLYFKKLGGKSH